MHDLNTIRRLNAEALHDAVANAQRQGRYVVATYAGLSLFSIESFSDEAAALQAVKAPVLTGDRKALFAPTGTSITDAPEPLLRDQSEDRALKQLVEAQNPH